MEEDVANKIYNCRKCGVVLDDDNWYASLRKRGDYICKGCRKEQACLWEKDNPEKARANLSHWRRENPDKAREQSTINHRREGHIPMSENKDCSQYLGVHIAERVLRHSFKNVEMMPYGNPGYDFRCNRGMLVDCKSSCQRKNGSWTFRINRNQIADYFLCLAFDNRERLNTLYAWLLPGEKFNHLTGTGISPSTIHKWDEYKLDISKISACCDVMKNGSD